MAGIEPGTCRSSGCGEVGSEAFVRTLYARVRLRSYSLPPPMAAGYVARLRLPAVRPQSTLSVCGVPWPLVTCPASGKSPQPAQGPPGGTRADRIKWLAVPAGRLVGRVGGRRTPARQRRQRPVGADRRRPARASAAVDDAGRLHEPRPGTHRGGRGSRQSGPHKRRINVESE